MEAAVQRAASLVPNKTLLPLTFGDVRFAVKVAAERQARNRRAGVQNLRFAHRRSDFDVGLQGLLGEVAFWKALHGGNVADLERSCLADTRPVSAKRDRFDVTLLLRAPAQDEAKAAAAAPATTTLTFDVKTTYRRFTLMVKPHKAVKPPAMYALLAVPPGWRRAARDLTHVKDDTQHAMDLLFRGVVASETVFSQPVTDGPGGKGHRIANEDLKAFHVESH